MFWPCSFAPLQQTMRVLWACDSYAARKRCHRKKLKRAAISIQKAYRGMKARAEADRLWLENTVSGPHHPAFLMRHAYPAACLR